MYDNTYLQAQHDAQHDASAADYDSTQLLLTQYVTAHSCKQYTRQHALWYALQCVGGFHLILPEKLRSKTVSMPGTVRQSN